MPRSSGGCRMVVTFTYNHDFALIFAAFGFRTTREKEELFHSHRANMSLTCVQRKKRPPRVRTQQKHTCEGGARKNKRGRRT